DNLPAELPRDASEAFGRDLIERVLPSLIGMDTNDLIARATIAENGELTSAFKYLADYAKS
ncbi:MAG: alanine dehydrogenase, partial [Flavobacteriales bacterium]